jgi:hypothetical protein
MFHLEVIGQPDQPRPVSAATLLDAVHADRGGVRLIHVVLDGPVDLNAVAFHHELILQHCTFRGHLDAGDGHFGKSVDLTRCTFEQNVNFTGARIDGSLYLTGATIHQGGPDPTAAHPARNPFDLASFGLLRLAGNLIADEVVTQAKLSFGGARIAGEASFIAANLLGGLNLEVAVVEGSLNCTRMAVRAADPNGPPDDGTALMGGIKVAGQVNLRGAVIERHLILFSAEVHCGLRCGPDGPQRTEIGGDVLLSAANISFGAEFSEARITGTLNLQDADLDGDLICQRTEIARRGADPDDPMAEGGTAHLAGVTVSGMVDFRGASVAHDLYLQSAVIKGGLYCRAFEMPATHDALEGTRTTIGKNAWLAAATVSGTVDFSGTSIGGDLSLDGATLEGGLFCRPWRIRLAPLDHYRPDQPTQATAGSLFCPTHVAGNALLAAAKVSGMVDFSGARIDGNLNLESADIKSGLFCRPLYDHHTVVGGRAILAAVRVSGVVDFTGAEVKEDLNLESADVKNGFCCKAAERRTVIGGSVLLNSARVSGGVNVSGAVIRSNFNLEGAVVGGELECGADSGQRTEVGGDALMGGARISGGIDMTGLVALNLRMPGAAIEGKLTAKDAVIGGRAVLNETKVSGQADFAGAQIAGDLQLQGAEVDGRFSCKRTRIGGLLDLRSCRMRVAELDLAPAEGAPGRPESKWPGVRIEGFQFQDLALGDREAGRVVNYLDLLRLSPTFEVSTYYSIEQWLRNRGDDDQANNIYLAMRQDRRKHMQMSGVARATDRLFDAAVFLALRFQWLFFVFLVMLAATVLVFSSPADALEHKAAREVAPTPTLTDSIAMAVQVNLPMIPFPVASKWEVTSNPINLLGMTLPMQYDHFASLMTLLAYIVVPLFVAGVANTWLRQKSAGGD